MSIAKYLLPFLFLHSVAAQPARYGQPACNTAGEEFADRTYFILCHSASRKVATWIGYELKPEHLSGDAPRSTHFRRDSALLHAGAQDSDYLHSGYSRGHLAPARDFAWSPAAIRATFLLSNAVPQLQSVNAGIWARLENAVRRAAVDADAAYVFAGPLFEGPDLTIGAGHVAVPSHFFKAVLVIKEGRRTMYAAIVPNALLASASLRQFETSVAEIEKRTGLNLFSQLEGNEQRQLESACPHLPN